MAEVYLDLVSDLRVRKGLLACSAGLFLDDDVAGKAISLVTGIPGSPAEILDHIRQLSCVEEQGDGGWYIVDEVRRYLAYRLDQEIPEVLCDQLRRLFAEHAEQRAADLTDGSALDSYRALLFRIESGYQRLVLSRGEEGAERLLALWRDTGEPARSALARAVAHLVNDLEERLSELPPEIRLLLDLNARPRHESTQEHGAATGEQARPTKDDSVSFGPILGIDFGTTKSAVAVVDGDGVPILPNDEGNRTTPSVVAFMKSGERLVGQIAKRQAITNARNTVFSIKRFMGRKYDEVTDEMKRVPYTVERTENGDVRIDVGGKKYSPPEIAAMVLGKLKQAAEDYLGRTVSRAVISVPAYFNDAQRQATKDAGRIAGLTVERLVNEPTAAALAYGLDEKKDQAIAVYDFGGGTFDISILEVGEGVVEVKSTNGDTHLGGDDIDQRIVEWLLDEFKKDQGIDLGNDPMAMQRLKEAAERAKIELSSAQETDVSLPFITADAYGPKHMKVRLTRPKLEQLVEDLIQRSIGPCRQALEDAGVEAKDIDEVVLVGGQTRMPAIQKVVKDFFGKEPHKGVNPDEVVAIGAAIQGGVITGEVKDMLFLDVTPLSLGIETLGGVFTRLIERNTTIPSRKSEIFSTAADNQTSVEVHVLQGEHEMARDNRSLGKFHLVGIPPAPRGVPQIELTFDIDGSGIVQVSAKDLGTGKEQKITVTASSGLSESDVDRMIRDAESHRSEDQERRRHVEARNQLDTLVYTVEKTYEEHKYKLSPDEKGQLDQAILQARSALQSEDTAQTEQAAERLTQASHTLAEAVYRRSGAAVEKESAPQAVDSRYVDVDRKAH